MSKCLRHRHDSKFSDFSASIKKSAVIAQRIQLSTVIEAAPSSNLRAATWLLERRWPMELARRKKRIVKRDATAPRQTLKERFEQRRQLMEELREDAEVRDSQRPMLPPSDRIIFNLRSTTLHNYF